MPAPDLTGLDPCSAEAFDRRYRAADDADPWAFRTSPYEQARYDAVVAALPRPAYDRAWEPACAIGELTARLAPRCGHLRATEISPTALARARDRCAPWPHVELVEAAVEDDPTTGLDLIVFSEVGYYFDPPALDRLIERVVAALVPGGDLVACHWLGHSEDHRVHGSVVHAAVGRHPELLPLDGRDAEGYRIDVWRRR